MPASQGGETPLPNTPVSNSPRSSSRKNVDTAVDDLPVINLWEIGVNEKANDKPFILETKLAGVPAEATTDSGACVNALDLRFYREHAEELGPLQPPDFSITVADGRKLVPEGAISLILELPHEKGSYSGPVRLQVLDTSDSWTMLLGKPWLRQVQAIVDYGKEEIAIGSRNWTNLHCSYFSENVRSLRSMGGEVLLSGNEGFTEQPEVLDKGPAGPDRAAFIVSKITLGLDLSEEQKTAIRDLIVEYNDIFALDMSDIRPCPHTTHSLNIDGGLPLAKKNFGRPLTQPELEGAKAQVDVLIKAGIIESTTPEEVKCCSPTVMATKKGMGKEISEGELESLAEEALADSARMTRKWQIGTPPCTGLELPVPARDGGLTPPTRLNVSHSRSRSESRADAADERTSERKHEKEPKPKIKYRLCHNFTQLNRATQVLPFPPGDLETKILKHCGKRWVCQMDAIGAFYWIPVSPESQPYLCFHIPGLGYYRYVRLPMGPTGSPGTYQIAVRRTHGKLLDPGPVSDWMDDLFTSGDEFLPLFETVKAIFENCKRDNMMLSPEKTKLFMTSACLGGTDVSPSGAQPSRAKVAALLKWPRPKNAREVLSFVNTAAVFRNSIANFAEIAQPLYSLTQGIDVNRSERKGAYKRALDLADVSERWGPVEEEAFLRLKTCLTNFPVVSGPRYDGRPFYIATDASAIGLGAHLYQLTDSEEAFTICYASRATSAAEKKLHSSELELLAVKWSLDKLAKYVYGQKIVLATDCQAVKDMLKNQCLTGARAAWKEAILGARIIELQHRPGRENVIADTLSRSWRGVRLPATCVFSGTCVE